MFHQVKKCGKGTIWRKLTLNDLDLHSFYTVPEVAEMLAISRKDVMTIARSSYASNDQPRLKITAFAHRCRFLGQHILDWVAESLRF